MSWLLRLGCVCIMIGLMSACDTGGDVGKPCKLTQEANINNLKELDTKARIVEASAACDLLSYCFANFYDETKHDAVNGVNTLGYCSKECSPDQNDCPQGFTCAVFINVETLPKDPENKYENALAPIHKRNVCIKQPPTEGQQ